MAGSRHLQGTLLSRVRSLLQSGAIKKKPCWFDVVERFPPIAPKILDKEAHRLEDIPNITYPEDDVKREFYAKHDRAKRDPHSLLLEVKTETTKAELFANHYQSLIDSGVEHDQALEQSFIFFQDHLRQLRLSSKSPSIEPETSEEPGTLHSKAELPDDIVELFKIKTGPKRKQRERKDLVED